MQFTPGKGGGRRKERDMLIVIKFRVKIVRLWVHEVPGAKSDTANTGVTVSSAMA